MQDCKTMGRRNGGNRERVTAHVGQLDNGRMTISIDGLIAEGHARGAKAYDLCYYR
jgi:hypothetical protein